MKKEKEQPQHLTRGDAEPIQIHHEADETLLAQWLRKGMEKGAGFWLSGLALAALTVALIWGLNTWLSRSPAGSEAWNDLLVPSTVQVPKDDPRYEGMPAAVRPFLKIADDHPNTTAAPWALLRAAAELHREGMRDLPNRRETARPMLQQAIELYDRVLKSVKANSPEALDALMGKARAEETRGDLEDAIATYKLAAERFPTAPDAQGALERAKELDRPDVRTFYTDFYAKDFSSFTPSAGGGMPGGGMTPFGTGPGGRSIEDLLKQLPALSDQPAGGNAPARPRSGLPGNLFNPSVPEGAKSAPPAANPAPAAEQPAETPGINPAPTTPSPEPAANPPAEPEPSTAEPAPAPSPAPAPETPKVEP